MSMTRRRRTDIAIVACAYWAMTSAAQAGDGRLELSATGAKVGGGFPVVIDAPGTYVLTTDLITSDPDVDAISIEADYVEIDLNGFRIGCIQPLEKSTCATGSGHGITVDDVFNRRGARVSNGTVFGMGGTGVRLGVASSATNLRVFDNWDGVTTWSASRVERVIATGNRQNGIFASGFGSSVLDSNAHDNTNIGIAVGSNGIVSRSSASGSSLNAIRGGEGASVLDNSVGESEGVGIRCTRACAIRGNAVVASGGIGISTEQGSVIDGNVVGQGADTGIRANQGSLVRGNAVYDNDGDGVFSVFGVLGLRENVIRNNSDGSVGSGSNADVLDLGANQCGSDAVCVGAIVP